MRPDAFRASSSSGLDYAMHCFGLHQMEMSFLMSIIYRRFVLIRDDG